MKELTTPELLERIEWWELAYTHVNEDRISAEKKPAWKEINDQAKKQIVALIKHPEMDFARALEMHHKAQEDFKALEDLLDGFKDSIREIVKKRPVQKPEITASFITRRAKGFLTLAETNAPLKIYQDFVAGLIKEIEEKYDKQEPK